MRGREFILVLVLLTAMAASAGAWVLELQPDVTLDRPVVRLADVVCGEIPTDAGELILRAGGKPGETVNLGRAGILRKLVGERLAGDVICRGAEVCRVTFSGHRIASDDLERRLLAALGSWMPRDPDRGPACWLELSSDLPGATINGDWRLELIDPGRLDPGRNLIRCKIIGGGRVVRFTATITCHSYGEVARATGNIARDDRLTPDLFVWEWRDLDDIDKSSVIGREAVQGMTAQSPITAGEDLRLAQIRPEPLVRQGESVELILERGGVSVTMRGTARENGIQGEMVYVRNELDGRLIRARVTGQGRLSWSRR
jgi:flagella basal body P-ring formation protein FlgA